MWLYVPEEGIEPPQDRYDGPVLPLYDSGLEGLPFRVSSPPIVSTAAPVSTSRCGQLKITITANQSQVRPKIIRRIPIYVVKNESKFRAVP